MEATTEEATPTATEAEETSDKRWKLAKRLHMPNNEFFLRIGYGYGLVLAALIAFIIEGGVVQNGIKTSLSSSDNNAATDGFVFLAHFATMLAWTIVIVTIVMAVWPLVIALLARDFPHVVSIGVFMLLTLIVGGMIPVLSGIIYGSGYTLSGLKGNAWWIPGALGLLVWPWIVLFLIGGNTSKRGQKPSKKELQKAEADLRDAESRKEGAEGLIAGLNRRNNQLVLSNQELEESLKELEDNIDSVLTDEAERTPEYQKMVTSENTFVETEEEITSLVEKIAALKSEDTSVLTPQKKRARTVELRKSEQYRKELVLKLPALEKEFYDNQEAFYLSPLGEPTANAVRALHEAQEQIERNKLEIEANQSPINEEERKLDVIKSDLYEPAKERHDAIVAKNAEAKSQSKWSLGGYWASAAILTLIDWVLLSAFMSWAFVTFAQMTGNG